MNHSLESVKSFHELFSHPVGKIGELEPLKTRQLRIKLLFEELAELAEASDCKAEMSKLCESYSIDLFEENGGIEDSKEDLMELFNELLEDRKITDGNNVDQIEELDALCDLQYVLNGKILTSGLHEVFDKNFDLVHENNMAKAHTSIAHANETITKLVNPEGLYNISGQGIFDETCIVTNSSGKVIKPWNHQKVKLTLNP